MTATIGRVHPLGKKPAARRECRRHRSPWQKTRHRAGVCKHGEKGGGAIRAWDFLACGKEYAAENDISHGVQGESMLHCVPERNASPYILEARERERVLASASGVSARTAPFPWREGAGDPLTEKQRGSAPAIAWERLLFLDVQRRRGKRNSRIRPKRFVQASPRQRGGLGASAGPWPRERGARRPAGAPHEENPVQNTDRSASWGARPPSRKGSDRALRSRHRLLQENLARGSGVAARAFVQDGTEATRRQDP